MSKRKCSGNEPQKMRRHIERLDLFARIPDDVFFIVLNCGDIKDIDVLFGLSKRMNELLKTYWLTIGVSRDVYLNLQAHSLHVEALDTASLRRVWVDSICGGVGAESEKVFALFPFLAELIEGVNDVTSLRLGHIILKTLQILLALFFSMKNMCVRWRRDFGDVTRFISMLRFCSGLLISNSRVNMKHVAVDFCYSLLHINAAYLPEDRGSGEDDLSIMSMQAIFPIRVQLEAAKKMLKRHNTCLLSRRVLMMNPKNCTILTFKRNITEYICMAGLAYNALGVNVVDVRRVLLELKSLQSDKKSQSIVTRSVEMFNGIVSQSLRDRIDSLSDYKQTISLLFCTSSSRAELLISDTLFFLRNLQLSRAGIDMLYNNSDKIARNMQHIRSHLGKMYSVYDHLRLIHTNGNFGPVSDLDHMHRAIVVCRSLYAACRTFILDAQNDAEAIAEPLAAVLS